MTAVLAGRPAVPARRRPTTWLALALLALALGMIAFELVALLLPGTELLQYAPSGVDVLVALTTWLSLLLTGTFLAVQRPGNPIGWLLLVSGLSFVYSYVGPDYVDRVEILGWGLPGHALVDWVLPPVENLYYFFIAIWIPILFPDGRLPGRRWRPVAWLIGFSMVTFGTLSFLTDDNEEFGRQLPNPTALGGDAEAFARLLSDAAAAAIVGSFVLALVAVIVRYRRSTGAERQQMKWFLAAVSLVFVSNIGMTVFFALGIPVASAFYVMTQVTVGLVPIAIGIAILRYRLYDIDRLISRTIGWALVTGILAAVFVGVVLVLQALLAGFTQGETLAIAASTLAAFALFQPLRRRVQVAVDRRFDRARYDGQQLVGAFGERLRDQVDLETIRAEVPATVDAAVRPATVGLWLRERAGVGR